MPRLLIATTVAETLRAFLVPYAEHFRAKGWRVDAMANGISGHRAAAAFDDVHEINWTRRATDVRQTWRAISRVRQVVRDGAYDIVHVHTPIAAFATRYALRERRWASRPSVIYTAHGFHFHRGGGRARNAIFRSAERVAARWTDFLVVINEEDFSEARRLALRPDQQLCYMPGIGLRTCDYDALRVTPQQVVGVRAEMGLAPTDVLFLIVAEFNPGKRHGDAIRALASIQNPAVHLALAGRGRTESSLRGLARDLAVEPRVHFLGYRTDVPVLMRASTATILPSEREGLPRAVMESLCLGVPAIGSDARGVRDVLSDGCGIVVPVGDVTALTAAMRRMIANPSEAADMAAKGRSRIRTDYDVNHLIELHESLYDRALQHRGAQR